jgi:hypothetical protein
MFKSAVLALAGVTMAQMTARAQTQIDLRTQAKTVDFSAASSTKPMKTGTVLPANCSTGEMFLRTDAPAGANLYACRAANAWSAQGANTVMSNGETVGTRAATNFSAGPGLLSIASDTGSEIDLLWALDTAVNQTQPGEQSGSALWCASGSGSASVYQCSMMPALSAYTAGMLVHWQPDMDGAGGPTTLNIDTLGAAPVKLADGLSDPGPPDIRAGRLYQVWYDGANFRLLSTTASVAGALADPGANGIVYRSGAGTASAATADQVSGPFFCQDTSGVAGAYACNLAPAITHYATGTTYWFRANTGNSGAATINFNSLGATTIKKRSSVDLATGDIVAGQWIIITYDGTNMQMVSQTAGAVVGGVTSVFGRAGAVSSQSGDYTTAQVTESGNLYFTTGRVLSAMSGLYQAPITTGTTAQYLRGNLSLATFPTTWAWSALSGVPSTFTPSSHASTHQNGGSDEVATATPGANAIPKAGAGGTLASGWLPPPGTSTLGGVQAKDCSATGLVQKINTDGTVTCASGSGGVTRTWNYQFQGVNYAGVPAFGGNLPANTTALPQLNASADLPVLNFPQGASSQYWYGSWRMPPAYPANGAISYTIFSMCDPANCDSTHAANVYISLACSGTTARPDSASYTELTAPIAITNSASGYQTVTSGTVTPNAGTPTLPACTTTNRATVKLRVDTTGLTASDAFQLVAVSFYVQGAI